MACRARCSQSPSACASIMHQRRAFCTSYLYRHRCSVFTFLCASVAQETFDVILCSGVLFLRRGLVMDTSLGNTESSARRCFLGERSPVRCGSEGLPFGWDVANAPHVSRISCEFDGVRKMSECRAFRDGPGSRGRHCLALRVIGA